jgi:FRG domain-containing protein
MDDQDGDRVRGGELLRHRRCQASDHRGYDGDQVGRLRRRVLAPTKRQRSPRGSTNGHHVHQDSRKDPASRNQRSASYVGTHSPTRGSQVTWPESEVRSWSDFIDQVDLLDLAGPSQTVFLFRGQSDARWSLEHSLRRNLRDLNHQESVLEIERCALRRFQEQAHLFLDPSSLAGPGDLVDWWALMQHHHAPTRLLDWTRSPYVAAYFAVEHNWDNHGALWLVHIGSLKKAMNHLQGHSEPTKPHEDRVRYYCGPNLPDEIDTIELSRQSARMVVQQGLFTVCRNVLGNHGEIIEEALRGSDDGRLKRLIIPARLKYEFLKKLSQMNITASSLFPGIDGLGHSMGEFIRMESHFRRHPRIYEGRDQIKRFEKSYPGYDIPADTFAVQVSFQRGAPHVEVARPNSPIPPNDGAG